MTLREFRKRARVFDRLIKAIEAKLDRSEEIVGKSKLGRLPKDLETSTQEALSHLRERLSQIKDS